MKLEVGKYYKNSNGRVVKIIEYHADKVYNYSDNEGCPYTEGGKYWRYGDLPENLIEEVIPVPAYRVKAEQTDMRDFVKSMESEKGKIFTEFRILKDSEKLVRLETYTYYATQVDAGYIDPITGEFVMNENESKKLKLEVGKTYRDGYGDLHTIVSNKSNLCYPEHTFWSDERSYTVEGFWQMEKKVHKYNLIEEVEVEASKTKTKPTKKEQPKMKYYRTTDKNTETEMPVGTIVTLFKDDGSQMPRYKEVNSDKYQYLFTDRLEEINVNTVKTVISPASKLVKILEDSGYVVSEDGHWRHPGKETFVSKMFCFCGEDHNNNRWSWLPEWLEEKVVSDSVINTFNARQFIVDFMEKKRELSHEAYLYQRDIDEIENGWSDEECKKVAGKILSQGVVDFTGSSCPFCIKFADRCDDCSYDKRHGRCGRDDSDFYKYIYPAVCGKVWPELLDFVDNYPGARK